ncbi:hypothetical protein DFP93_102352 [Aneurinibacillus soli]|uniref:Uncharacterized protein n=1 Tax=Aneurinibacillus soli TaxID=1500254 RepID=A0A0U5AUI0_9BACL|nr:hypothetical protein [Aneurinibacillus soli]PYE63665.1 hypothetical protein DFP93_102352 [Aneurinibacillus soli]BAU27402.1 hypothetical protein CB4_01576 [Aneurinibacillus soli]
MGSLENEVKEFREETKADMQVLFGFLNPNFAWEERREKQESACTRLP